MDTLDVARLIREVPDYPQPGVMFRDITPLLASPDGFAASIDALVGLSPTDIDVVVGIEARGFLFGAPVALALGAGFVPIRKPGKLPRGVVTVTYDLEYGTRDPGPARRRLRAGHPGAGGRRRAGDRGHRGGRRGADLAAWAATWSGSAC